MPKRDDIQTILLIGSGPIVIGQACEFDYSGTQGAKALKEEGYRVILVNSNPATVMTDPEFADQTYIEPLTVDVLTRIIERERPQAILPTLGGQTALNLALNLDQDGVLAKYGVELIGANVNAIRKAEDRELFKQAMERIGLRCPKAYTVSSVDEGKTYIKAIGFPAILRPSFTLGGTGGGIVHHPEDFERALSWALEQSPVHQCLVEESVLGYKEFELEVIRDKADNFAVICTIENFDPMGVHTGDSITVAPAMTLTDKEYQRLRDAAKAIMSEIGVQTGGSNVQFGVNPENGDVVVIEMNPRVSRSSALASKATGYPIARIAAKLAIGYTLDELTNSITGTSAAFEPTMDYVVCKIPRFAFEKFTKADARLTTQMKSVGEVMSMGRTFQLAIQKAARGLENGRGGLISLLDSFDYEKLADSLNVTTTFKGEPIQPMLTGLNPKLQTMLKVVSVPLSDRLWYIGDAFRVGATVEQLRRVTQIDAWFLEQIQLLVIEEKKISGFSHTDWAKIKSKGFSDAHLGALRKQEISAVRKMREAEGARVQYARVDTCAAEFEAQTPYLYSNDYVPNSQYSESRPSTKKKIMILGGGPNRIGQGIEFDYCCVHAVFALKELGYETIMVNCNPETVSTDYDTSDRLYFEPVTFEDVLSIAEVEKPEGVIVQFGGQTPLKLAVSLARAGVRVLGTPAEAIDRAEDREKFEVLLEKLKLKRPAGAIANDPMQAAAIATKIGYPVVVRPSYVLGGRAMEIVHSESELERYMRVALGSLETIDAGGVDAPARTILVDHFLEDAVEVDVDCVADGETVVVGGILQHIEEAGIHSGDSAMVLPPHGLSKTCLDEIRDATTRLALELGVRGLMNVQFAVKDEQVYVIEVNPRASRTVPFVSKAIGLPLAKIAAKVMAGHSLKSQGVTHEIVPPHYAVKESVFPFSKFPGVDTLLGPEMRSTGEVMGIAATYPEAYARSLLGASMRIPTEGTVLISVQDDHKRSATEIAKRLQQLGFELAATHGTAKALSQAGLRVSGVNKVADGSPHVVDRIAEGAYALVINTTSGAKAIEDSYSLRRQTLLSSIPYVTTLAAADAVVSALESGFRRVESVKSIQEYHRDVAQNA